MLRVKTGRKRLKTSTTCECFFKKIEEISIPSRGIATHGSHASGRWLGVLASVLKSRGRCGSHMKADHGWSTFFVTRFWNLTLHSLQHFYGARCAFRYFAGDAESIHPDTLEARHQPKGFTIFPKDRWRKSCTMFRSTTYQPVQQPSRMVWFVITLHGPPPLPPYCRHDCPMFFVLSPILSQSVCPYHPTIRPSRVSACGTLNSRLPSARSPQSVSRTMRSRCHLQLMSTGNGRKGHLLCRSIVVSGWFTTWKIR